MEASGGVALEGHVGVPGVRLGALVAVQNDYLRVGLVKLGDVRVDLEFAEAGPERDVGVRVEILVREEQDEVVEPGGSDLVPGRVVDPVEIDARDLGADATGQGPQVERCHCRLVHGCLQYVGGAVRAPVMSSMRSGTIAAGRGTA